MGALFASWVIPMLAALPVDLIPGGTPISGVSDATVDMRVLGFTFSLSLLTTAVVGLFPALQNSGLSAMESLRSSSSAMGRYRRQLASKSLVIFEVAISLTLLIGAGLVFRSFLNVLRVDPGFNPAHVLTLQINPQVPAEPQRRTYFVNLLTEVKRIRGVQTAALVAEPKAMM